MSLITNWSGSQRFFLLKRHLSIIIRYLTLKKIKNILIALNDFQKRKEKPLSSPLYIKVEPTRICNLRCTGCVQSAEGYKTQAGIRSQFKIENFKKVIDALHKTLLGISFSYYGEPLLGKSLMKMIKYAHDRGVGTMFPTNFSVKISEDKAKEIVNSGLDMMMISLDGASKETYSKYRIGGNFDLVLENVEKIHQAKISLNRKSPHLRWKFIVFDHNKHETDFAKQNYKKLGFDSLSLEGDMYNKESKEKIRKSKYLRNIRDKKLACFWVWFTLIIEYNGDVSPCCGIDDLVSIDTFDLGNVYDTPVLEIWRGESYQKLRKGFKKKESNDTLHSTCQTCVGVKRPFTEENKTLAPQDLYDLEKY